MQTVVDLTHCQGCAQCVPLAPEVFQLHGEEGLPYATAVPDDRVERAPGLPAQAIFGAARPGLPPRCSSSPDTRPRST
ncbi:ferredoxin [Streptomyces sp. NPDC006208]|uniref:ferredoxin n=1 Tax=Streptomyces sp. NPDC006208 TaxID=3156734 RepID=UPI0033B1FEED